MDAVGICLVIAAAAALAASVLSLGVIRSHTPAAAQPVAAPEEPPTATQPIANAAILAPSPALAVRAQKEAVTRAPAPAAQSAPGESLAQTAAPAPLKRAAIIAVKGVESKEWLVGETRMVIGRSQDAECFIPSLTVSRKHAIIERRGEQIILTDCGSRNGTYVRGVRIDQPVVLRNGDTIEMGEIVLRIAIG